jgi:hypothetical protein
MSAACWDCNLLANLDLTEVLDSDPLRANRLAFNAVDRMIREWEIATTGGRHLNGSAAGLRRLNRFIESRCTDARKERRQQGTHASIDSELEGDDGEMLTLHETVTGNLPDVEIASPGNVAGSRDSAITAEYESSVSAITATVYEEDDACMVVTRCTQEEISIAQISRDLGKPRSTVHDAINRLRGKSEAPDALEHQPVIRGAGSGYLVRDKLLTKPPKGKAPSTTSVAALRLFYARPENWRDYKPTYCVRYEDHLKSTANAKKKPPRKRGVLSFALSRRSNGHKLAFRLNPHWFTARERYAGRGAAMSA